KFVNPVEFDAFIANLAGSNGPQLNLRPGDQAGQAHAADGGCVQFWIFFGGTEDARSIGTDQLKARYMVAERTGDVVVFAVDIVGNRTANADIFCARTYRQEPAARYGKLQNLRQRGSAFAPQQSCRGIELDEAVHSPR